MLNIMVEYSILKVSIFARCGVFILLFYLLSDIFVQNKDMYTLNDLKKPELQDIKKDSMFPLYEDFRQQKGLLGYAKLNHRVTSIVTEYPYVRAEIGNSALKQPNTIIWCFQRWNVTYVDPREYDKTLTQEERFKYLYQRGFTTNWNIPYYLCTSSTLSSGITLEEENKDYLNDTNDLF